MNPSAESNNKPSYICKAETPVATPATDVDVTSKANIKQNQQQVSIMKATKNHNKCINQCTNIQGKIKSCHKK